MSPTSSEDKGFFFFFNGGGAGPAKFAPEQRSHFFPLLWCGEGIGEWESSALLRKPRPRNFLVSTLEGTTLVVEASPPVTMTLGVGCACDFFPLGPL